MIRKTSRNFFPLSFFLLDPVRVNGRGPKGTPRHRRTPDGKKSISGIRPCEGKKEARQYCAPENIFGCRILANLPCRANCPGGKLGEQEGLGPCMVLGSKCVGRGLPRGGKKSQASPASSRPKPQGGGQRACLRALQGGKGKKRRHRGLNRNRSPSRRRPGSTWNREGKNGSFRGS